MLTRLFYSSELLHLYHLLMNLSEGDGDSVTEARKCENDIERLSERDIQHRLPSLTCLIGSLFSSDDG